MLASLRGASAATKPYAGRHLVHSRMVPYLGPGAATCARPASSWVARVTARSWAAPGAAAAPPRRSLVSYAMCIRSPAARPISCRRPAWRQTTTRPRRGLASTAGRRGKDADGPHQGPTHHAAESSGGGGPASFARPRERVGFDSRLEYGSVLPRGVEDVEQFSLGIVSRFADRMMQSLKRPRPPTQFVAALGHAGSMIGLSAYFMSVRAAAAAAPPVAPHAARLLRQDMFYLRTMAMCGSFCGMLYHALQPQPMWIPMAWGSLFVIANAVMIYGILQEQSEVSFQDWEMDFYDSYFLEHGVRPRQFQRLMAAGQWVDCGSGDVLVGPGGARESNVVIMIQSGEAEVVINGKVVASVGPGSFVGSAAGLFAGSRGSAGNLPSRTRPVDVETALNEAEEEAAAEADFAARGVVAAVTAPSAGAESWGEDASAARGDGSGPAGREQSGVGGVAFESASRRAAMLLAGHQPDRSGGDAAGRAEGEGEGEAGRGSAAGDSEGHSGDVAGSPPRKEPSAPHRAASVGLVDALDAAHSRVRRQLGRISGAASGTGGRGGAAAEREGKAVPGSASGPAVVAGPEGAARDGDTQGKPPLVGVGPMHSDSLRRTLHASAAARAHQIAVERRVLGAEARHGAAGAGAAANAEEAGGGSPEGDRGPATAGNAPSSRLVRTKTPCRYVLWRVGDLQQHLEAEKGMALPMSTLVTRDLKQKLAQVESQLFLATYREIVRAVVADGQVSPRQREVLREFRERHDIEDEWHQDVLAEFGWTRGEFDAGRRGTLPRISLGGVAGAVSQVSRDLGSWLQSGSLFEVGSGLWDGGAGGSRRGAAAHPQPGDEQSRTGGWRSNGSYEDRGAGEHEDVYENGPDDTEEEAAGDPYAALTHDMPRRWYTMYRRPYGAQSAPATGETGAGPGSTQLSAGSDAGAERRHHHMSALSSADDAMHTAGVDGSALLRSLLRHNERLRLGQRAVEEAAAAAAQAHLQHGPPAVPTPGPGAGEHRAPPGGAEEEAGEEGDDSDDGDEDGGEDVFFILDEDDQP